MWRASVVYMKWLVVIKNKFAIIIFMLKKLLFIIFFSLVFCFCQSAFCDSVYNFDGFISDNAGVLNSRAKASINALMWDLQKKTGADVAVVTVKSLDGRSVEETALNIGRKYKIGKKGEDTGAVILVAPNDRRLRIEIGYGLEGIITDGKAGRIRDEEMLPYFKKGDYESGIWRGSYALAQNIAKGYGVTLSDTGPVPKAPSKSEDNAFFVLFVIIFLCIRFNIFPIFIPFGGYGSRYDSGFGGGGFGGFGGGGGFDGGGASGGW